MRSPYLLIFIAVMTIIAFATLCALIVRLRRRRAATPLHVVVDNAPTDAPALVLEADGGDCEPHHDDARGHQSMSVYEARPGLRRGLVRQPVNA